MNLYAFEVTVAGKPDWGQTINARTPGQAKSEYHRHITDAWPDVPWTALRCRKLGPPQTSERFRSNALYRGIPALQCGQRVRVGDGTGVVVSHDDSCNFIVLFDHDSKQYANLRLSVHPKSLVLI